MKDTESRQRAGKKAEESGKLKCFYVMQHRANVTQVYRGRLDGVKSRGQESPDP